MTRRSIAAVVLVTSAMASSWPQGFAQTIVNVPPSPAPTSISGDTILNLFDGGELPSNFAANSGATVNVFGGSVQSYFNANAGSIVNVSGGNAGIYFNANSGSLVNIQGGTVSGLSANAGATVSIQGGEVGIFSEANAGSTVNIGGAAVVSYFAAQSGSQLNIAGGTMTGYFSAATGATVGIHGGSFAGKFDADAGSNVSFYGVDFAIDNVPVSGLKNGGDRVTITVPLTSQFTGTLADGTPFAFSYLDDDSPYNVSFTLIRTSLAGQLTGVTVPSDPVPRGISRGQTLVLRDGGVVGDNFQAGTASSVVIQGGSIGANFEAAGANVDITGGHVGQNFTAFAGTTVNISQGTIDYSARLLPGATINMTGGRIRSLFVPGSGVLNLSGGGITTNLRTTLGAALTISGANFQLNGQPVSGVGNIGDTIALQVPGNAQGFQLTGTLADGTPFAFTNTDNDEFDGPITLRRAGVAPVGPALVHLPSDPVPSGLRSGQTLLVENGGILGDDFNAGVGSRMIVHGGAIGSNFEAVGTSVEISGGQVGTGFDAFYGTTVHVSGGTIGSSFRAKTGSIVNIDGGTIQGLVAESGSFVNIRGGSVGVVAQGSATVNISGGRIASGFYASNGAIINVFGSEFLLNGIPISGLQAYGDSILAPIQVGNRLEATLADGSFFDLIFGSSGRSGPDFLDSSVTLRLTLAAPEPDFLALSVLAISILSLATKPKRRKL